MSKRHTIFVLLDANGRYVDAFLSYSEADLALALRGRSGSIVRVNDREDY